MITNYPTLKIKTHSNLIPTDVLMIFLPLDLTTEINNKFVSGAKSIFINKALANLNKASIVLFVSNSNKRIVCATASIFF